MCVPLILLDKLPLAEMYVRGHPNLQQRLVTLLDSWCDPHFNIQALLRWTCNTLSLILQGENDEKHYLTITCDWWWIADTLYIGLFLMVDSVVVAVSTRSWFSPSIRQIRFSPNSSANMSLGWWKNSALTLVSHIVCCSSMFSSFVCNFLKTCHFYLTNMLCVTEGLCPSSVYKRKLDSLKFLMYKTFGEVRTFM